MSRPAPTFTNLSLSREGNIFIITLQRGSENRLNTTLCNEVIRAFHYIQRTLGPNSEGAVITRGNNAKFWCTGVDQDERDDNPFANSDGFFPMIHTILDFPFPTVALLTGHTFGGACPFALSHDYRIMNSERGFISMPPVNLGMHFQGMGTLLSLKLSPKIARKMLLQAHKWTGKEALADGVVDDIASPEAMLDAALKVAREWAPKAKAGVYGVLRHELYGEATRAFALISHVHSRETNRRALVKL
ncbi:hypothetical protein QM012_002068 [Aureobasidium pullulans]|uniref:ClpP/crotonase n=1 Tax=Aureobasidium pullulans TaxID=5580 RepID=A0ABR0TDB6_AURPU